MLLPTRGRGHSVSIAWRIVRRSRSWSKPPPWSRAAAHAAAVTAPRGSRTASPADSAAPRLTGASWFGERINGELRHRGVVEWGFNAADVLELIRATRYERDSPFADLPAGHAGCGVDHAEVPCRGRDAEA